MFSLGIDVGGSSVKVAALRGDGGGDDHGGGLLWQAQSRTYARPTRDELAAVIRDTIAGRFEPGGVVGLCVPGVRDASGRTVTLSVNLPALNGLSLDELVERAVGSGSAAGVHVCNDAVAAALDLYATRQLRGRLLALALGTGVGGAVIDEGGVPLRVDGDSPGHLGQLDCSVEGDPVIGPDGGAGSLEGYIGVPALVARYGADVTATLQRLGPHDSALKALARAIRIGHAVYCMDHVALTGGLGNRMSHLVPALRQLVAANLTSVARPQWTLFTGSDDYHAAKGAAQFARRESSR